MLCYQIAWISGVSVTRGIKLCWFFYNFLLLESAVSGAKLSIGSRYCTVMKSYECSVASKAVNMINQPKETRSNVR